MVKQIRTPSINAQCRSMPIKVPINANHCQSILINQNWSSMIGIDWHHDQCHNFDRNWLAFLTKDCKIKMICIDWQCMHWDQCCHFDRNWLALGNDQGGPGKCNQTTCTTAHGSKRNEQLDQCTIEITSNVLYECLL